MKKRIYTLFTTLNLLFTLSFVSARAQSPGDLTANIPFAFTVGNKTLPAGEYIIQLPASSGMYSQTVIRSADYKEACIALTMPVQPRRYVKQAKLIFIRHDGQHYLSQVFASGEDDGQELSLPKSVERLAKAQPERHTVSVLGNFR